MRATRKFSRDMTPEHLYLKQNEPGCRLYSENTTSIYGKSLDDPSPWNPIPEEVEAKCEKNLEKLITIV